MAGTERGHHARTDSEGVTKRVLRTCADSLECNTVV